MDIPNDLRHRLASHGQEHVLRWWQDIDDRGQRQLADQLAACDLDQLARLTHDIHDGGEDDPTARSHRAIPPRDLIRLSDLSGDPERVARAGEVGREMLARGEVGALVVAGGQGTRLGFPHAKGLFPIGPVSGAVLLAFLCGQVRARQRQSDARIPYYVMTSDATHDELVAAFEAQDGFGLEPEDVVFFRQGNMPAVDASSGRLLLSERDSLALSPDGHGGLIAALRNGRVFDDLRRRGVRTLFYHQVDNPCASLCDPLYLGLHRLANSELSTKVVAKRDADEKMGVLVDVDGHTQIIEYSDFPAEVARRTEADGSLRFWAGNTAIHAIEVEFLRRLSNEPDSLPLHRALKKVAHLDATGTHIDPAEPNAWKFERFLFDALPLAARALVVETAREREFNPVKNASGNDSPETCRAALQAIWKGWLADAGADVPPDAVVEIAPEFALDAEELSQRRVSEQKFTGPAIYLHD